jgi:hypothetical protein
MRWVDSLSLAEQHLLPCPFKFLTGCDCPTCGTQRSILSLLKGDFLKSWEFNPLGLGLFFLGSVYLLMRLAGWEKRMEAMRLLSFLLVALVMFRWMGKLVNGSCFD